MVDIVISDGTISYNMVFYVDYILKMCKIQLEKWLHNVGTMIAYIISEDDKSERKIKKTNKKRGQKNPYTDEQISEFFQVSRESVTNLRNELNIPNSRERRMNNLICGVNSILEKNENISERDLTEKINEMGFKVSRHTIRECKKEIKTQKKESTKNTNENIDNFINAEQTNTISLSKPEEGYQSFKNIIGSEGSLKPHIQLAKAAVLYPPQGLHTLILGDTGVGKSELAAAMYEFAKEAGTISKEMPFIIFNCSDYADNPQLLMAQLFGYVKGTFTGAEEDKEGLVEKANESIIFLDEVHRLPPEGQELLFYIIDKGKFRRLGETNKERYVQVTIIAATTENPDSTLKEKEGREMVKILVACGTGICTSTMAVDKLKRELERRGKTGKFSITQCKIAELSAKSADYDLIVATTQVSSKISTPVISGLPFLTGVGIDKVVDEVIEKLNL